MALPDGTSSPVDLAVTGSTIVLTKAGMAAAGRAVEDRGVVPQAGESSQQQLQ